MSESSENKKSSKDSAGEDVADVERGEEDEKGTMDEEVDRAREREAESTEG